MLEDNVRSAYDRSVARRRWLASFAAATVLGCGLAAQASADASLPSYLTANSAQFSINEHWQGAKKITGGTQVGVQQVTGDPGETVWAPTCGAGQQTFTISRQVELLGPPTDGSFYWWTYPDGAPSGWVGATSLQLSVNGNTVFRWKSPQPQNHFDFPKSTFKDIRVGSNSFVLKVTRAALPKGVSACNGRNSKPIIALAGSFKFDFATDLRVGVPKEDPAIRQATSVITTQFVKNEGPDRAVNGYLLVYFGGNPTNWAVTIGGHPCDHPDNADWYCRFDELDPGKRLSVIMKVAYTPTPGMPGPWDHAGSSITFKAYWTGSDSNSANDTAQTNFILCETGSTYAQCAHPG